MTTTTTLTVTFTLGCAVTARDTCTVSSRAVSTDRQGAHDRGEHPVNADEIVEGASYSVVLDALAAACQDIDAVLDKRKPTSYRLSRTADKLARALRAMGSSSAEAKGLRPFYGSTACADRPRDGS